VSVEIELCWPTVRQAGFVELVEVAAAAGFGALTVSTELCRRSSLDHPTLRRHLDEAGVRVTAVDGLPGALPGLAPSAAWSESEVLDLASALGAGGVNVSHFGGDPSVPRPVLAEALARVAARAAGYGLTVILEFIPGTAVPDLDAAVDIVTRSGAARAGILLDTWHLHRSGGSPAMLTGGAVHAVAGLQLADRRRAQDDEPYVPMTGRLLPGEGELPLAEVVTAVRRARPDLPVGIEIFSEALFALPAREAAARAAASLRRTVASVDPGTT
jgi:sugar phosphate isomerase/epimerase